MISAGAHRTEYWLHCLPFDLPSLGFLSPSQSGPMIHNPHNALFQAVFSQPEHARGVLRGIVPAAVSAAIDWSKLSLRSGNFVDVVQIPRCWIARSDKKQRTRS